MTRACNSVFAVIVKMVFNLPADDVLLADNTAEDDDDDDDVGTLMCDMSTP